MAHVEKYKTESGECPIDEFINELIKDGQRVDVVKIQSYVDLLKELGDDILSNSNWAKKLDDKIFELRPKSNRVLYFYHSLDDKYVLLHCFKKKTTKTPKGEIDRARKEASDYERRNSNGR